MRNILSMDTESILIALDWVARSGNRYAEAAAGLIRGYEFRGRFTGKQRRYALAIIDHTKRSRVIKKRFSSFWLYAISDGVNVKLGVAKHPGSRLKQLQTSNANPLRLLWQLNAGEAKGAAYKAERRLHRYCGDHRIRGEWFRPSCMALVRSFKLKTSGGHHA